MKKLNYILLCLCLCIGYCSFTGKTIAQCAFYAPPVTVIADPTSPLLDPDPAPIVVSRGLSNLSKVDCAGVINGSAYLDNCQKCVGGTTGRTACVQDCAGVINGSAYFDNCQKCVGGTTGKLPCGSCATVVFSETPGDKYGYDDFTMSGSPWVSSWTKDSTVIQVSIIPADTSYKRISFASLTPTNATINPLTAPSTNFALGIKGQVSKGEAEIDAICGLTGTAVKKMNSVTYDTLHKSVAVRVINSKSHTKPDGTVYPGYSSSDVSDASIKSYLVNCYKQAVVVWDYVRDSAMTVDFDLNSDGLLDIANGSALTNEENVIINQCKDSNYSVTLFLVSHPSDSSITGLSLQPGPFSFVFDDSPDRLNTIAHELGHSVFGLPDVYTSDITNIMYNTLVPGSPAKLRKDQWKTVHANQK